MYETKTLGFKASEGATVQRGMRIMGVGQARDLDDNGGGGLGYV